MDEKLKESIDKLSAILLEERKSIMNLGIKIPLREILREFKKMPWWKRLFMTPKRKKLKKAQITLEKINERRRNKKKSSTATCQ